MDVLFVKIIAVILVFAVGYLLKSLKILKKDDGGLLLKLIFYAAVPSIVLLSVSKVKLSLDFVYFPIILFLIILVTYIISFFCAKLFNFERSSFGVFLVACVIMNTGFLLPFIAALNNQRATALWAIFDAANILFVFTFAYYLACKYGKNNVKFEFILKKFLFSPVLWALFAGFVLNVFELQLPSVASETLLLLGNLAGPLLMLALGIYFEPKFKNMLPIFCAICIRMVLGFFLGVFFVRLLGICGLNKSIIILSAAAPVGYNTLTFSSLENLNTEFAANLVSFSMLIGLITTSFLMFWLKIN